MALHSLYKITFFTTANSPFVVDDVVIVYYDDVTGNIVTKLNDVVITSGPSLGDMFTAGYFPVFSLTQNYSYLQEPSDEPNYQFCTSNTLTRFVSSLIFPYGTKIQDLESPTCTGAVCDIQFLGTPVLVKPSTISSTDGSITVVASSSITPIKFGLFNADYADLPNTTGIFTGLSVGEYTIYAKSSNGCTATIFVKLVSEENYYTKYRISYLDIFGVQSRVDINKLDYVGAVNEIICGSEPTVIRMRGENSNFFEPVFSTEATISIISQTNQQYIELFTGSDLEYQIVYYKGPSYDLKWKGFITPSLYTEPYYLSRNYEISIDATDRITYLTDEPFLDDSGNKIKGDVKLIEIIATILRKTKMNLAIRVACNLYEQNMNTAASDDPLDQAYINAETTYYDTDSNPLKCSEVLKNILSSYGCRIVQWNNYWNILRIDELTTSYTYRQFTKFGLYQSNGTTDPVLTIGAATATNRLVWRDRSVMLEILGGYQAAIITQKLFKKKFYFTNGGFEDITFPETYPNNIVGYPNWTLVLNGNTASFGYLLAENQTPPHQNNSLDGSSGKYAAVLVTNSDSGVRGEDCYLISKEEGIVFRAQDDILFTFDFLPSQLEFPVKYVKFKFSLRIGTYYLQANGTWSTDADKQWVEVIVGENDFKKWSKIQIQTNCPDVSVLTETTTQARLMPGSVLGYSGSIEGDNDDVWQFNSLSRLKALPTVNLPAGYIAWVYYTDANGAYLRYYKLIVSTRSQDSPSILRPDDYNASTNKVVWENIHTDNRVVYGQVRKFDNVNIEVFPNGASMPDSKEYKSTNDANYRKNFELELINGDAPIDIENAKNCYTNFYKLSDGTPTKYWVRDGVSELHQLLALCSKSVIEQFTTPKYKLTGALTGDVFPGFINTYVDTNKKYIPLFLEIADKSARYQVELNEVLSPATAAANPFDLDEFDNDEFGGDFN